MRIIGVLAAALWGLAGAATAQTVVLVRHAEKADASRDPVLSEAGSQRAQALASAFGTDGPELILVSPFQRTALTAAPTATAFGLTPTAIGLDSGADAHVAAIVSEIRAQPADAVVLVVGHSNTVPLIARALGVEAADMPECEYDRVTRIHLMDGHAHAAVERYGAPSTC